MGALGERLKAWGQRTIRKFDLVRAAGLLVVWIVGLVFQDWVLQKALPAIGRAILWLAKQPMSVGGWVLVCLIASLMVMAFIETIPVYSWLSRKRSPAPVVLSADDKHAIARIRSLWIDEGGGKAIEAMFEFLRSCENHYTESWHVTFWKTLRDNLKEKAEVLNGSLSFGEPKPLQVVIKALEGVYEVYLADAEILYMAHRQGGVDLGVHPFNGRFHEIRDRHARFTDAIRLANNFQGMDRALKMFIPTGMVLASRKFLGEQPWDGTLPPRLPPRTIPLGIQLPVSSVDI